MARSEANEELPEVGTERKHLWVLGGCVRAQILRMRKSGRRAWAGKEKVKMHKAGQLMDEVYEELGLGTALRMA